jgi:cyclic pyranopterin phosphate synthase
MPETVKFLPQRDVLTFEEILRFVSIVAPLGVDRIRLTGGEPLVRSQLSKLVRMLGSVDGIEEIAMTTNAVLLGDHAVELKAAGLGRLNISLDTIDQKIFSQVTRRDVLPKVLTGIEAAKKAGFEKIRINAVPIQAIDDEAILGLARFCIEQELELRFIEFMPLDADGGWNETNVRGGEDIRRLISEHISELIPLDRKNPSQPAKDYCYSDRKVRVGFIDSVTQPFCDSCNRMRITAEGKFRNCLFSNAEWDLKDALKHGTDFQVESIVRESILAKKRGHGSDDGQFVRPDKAMYQIGG